MISQREFGMIEAEALRNIYRLLSVGVSGPDIAVVMTRDVYLAAASMNYVCWNTESTAEGTTIYAAYKGYSIFIIDDTDSSTTFQPAIKGLRISGLNYEVLSMGDLIVADVNPTRLYAMTQAHPPCFSDTGRTVTLESNRLTNGRVTFADRIRAGQEANRNGRMYSPSAFAPGDGYYIRQTPADSITPSIFDQSVINELERQFNEIGSGSLWSSIPSELRDTIAPKRKKRPAKEQEKPLTPEDTKELDEFLNSFAKKPMLESAT